MVDVELGIETFSCKRNLEAAGFFAVFKEGLAVLVYISERRASAYYTLQKASAVA